MAHPFQEAFTRPPTTISEQVLLEFRKFMRTTILFNIRVAEKVGLGLTDIQLLHLLHIYGPSTPGRLAQGCGLSSGGVTVALDRLEKAGYIRREPNPSDRRSLLIQLVAESLGQLSTIYEGTDVQIQSRLAQFTPAELDAVLRFFDAMQSVPAFLP